MKYRRITEIEATKWIQSGDHEEVRSWKRYNVGDSYRNCTHCSLPYAEHGWIVDGEYLVCPGDYIIEGKYGYYPIHADEFLSEHEPAE